MSYVLFSIIKRITLIKFPISGVCCIMAYAKRIVRVFLFSQRCLIRRVPRYEFDVPILTLGIQNQKQKSLVIGAEPYCPSLYCNLSMSRVVADMLQDGNFDRRQTDYHLDVYD